MKLKRNQSIRKMEKQSFQQTNKKAKKDNIKQIKTKRTKIRSNIKSNKKT